MAGWFYRRHDEQFGPVSWDDLRHLVESHGIHASDLVSQNGVTNWRAAGEIPGLFEPPPFPAMRAAGAQAVSGALHVGTTPLPICRRQSPPATDKPTQTTTSVSP